MPLPSLIHPPVCALRRLAATLRISPMGEGPKSKELQAERDRYLPRGMASTMPVFAASGRGATLTDVDGNAYIDFATGISVLNVGHGHPRLRTRNQRENRRPRPPASDPRDP